MNYYKNILEVLDKNQYSTDQNIIKTYSTDWRGEYIGDTDLVIFPDSIKKVSEVLKICQKENISIVR